MTQPTFDIFSGQPGQDAIWVEAVVGLSNARERMQQIAAKEPGTYFVFSATGRSVLAQIETFKKIDNSKAKAACT
jgi:hypothetical protein